MRCSRSIGVVALSGLVTFAAATATLVVNGPAALAGEADPSTKETIGDLRIGAPAATVKKALGAPTKKSKIQLQEADGSYVQTWEYPAKGIALQMAAESSRGAQTIATIEIKAPCTLKTARGIGIGSALTELTRAYGADRNAEESDDGAFVVGSSYGGVIFKLAAGRVERIFVGAAAE